MAAVFGAADKFDIGGTEPFPNYLERLEFYFLANDIATEPKKKAIFLSAVGAETYKLIRNLCTPDNPMGKTYIEITQLLSRHLNPEPNIIIER